MVWKLPLCYIFFHCRMVSSKLPFGCLAPSLFSGVVARSKYWQRLLSALTVVDGWVPGIEPFLGFAVYIDEDTTFLCKQKSCLLPLTGFWVCTDLTNHIQCGWNKTYDSLPIIITSNKCVFRGTGFPDFYYHCLSWRMIIWILPASLDTPSSLLPCLDL